MLRWTQTKLVAIQCPAMSIAIKPRQPRSGRRTRTALTWCICAEAKTALSPGVRRRSGRRERIRSFPGEVHRAASARQRASISAHAETQIVGLAEPQPLLQSLIVLSFLFQCAGLLASLPVRNVDTSADGRIDMKFDKDALMHVLVCASRKGGGGKTVCARHLAVSALNAGLRVAIIDLDPMVGLTRWWSRRAEDALELLDLTPEGMARDTSHQRIAAAGAAASALAKALPSLTKAGHDLLIIDTPPAADEIVALAIASADLVLVPVRPSPDDLDAVGETVDLISAAKKPMIFVVNAATRKARLTSDAAIALSQHGTVSPSVLHRADAYAASALDGRTVGEVDSGGRPASEVADLWQYVSKRIGLQASLHASKKLGRKVSKVVDTKLIQEPR